MDIYVERFQALNRLRAERVSAHDGVHADALPQPGRGAAEVADHATGKNAGRRAVDLLIVAGKPRDTNVDVHVQITDAQDV